MGQITLDTPFGQALRDLAADSRFKIFLESGCWDGEGSTLCIVKGLESRSPEDLSGAGLFSVETNKDLWMVASRYWKDRNPPLRILWARLGDRMMSKEKVEGHPLFEQTREHYDQYFEKDVKWFLNTRVIRFRRCDVYICDGGEFSTEGEWDNVRKLKPKVVCLNGINGMKAKDLYELLYKKMEWKPLFISTAGAGSAILEAPNDSDEMYPALPIWRPVEPAPSQMILEC